MNAHDSIVPNATQIPCARCGETDCGFYTTEEEFKEELEQEEDAIAEFDHWLFMEEEGLNEEIYQETGELVPSAEQFGFIYLITNRHSGKKYVGQTVGSPTKRWRVHLRDARCGSMTRFHQELRKYGEAAFTYEVIDHAQSQPELNRLETHFIRLLNSCHPDLGYNTRRTA